MVRAITRKTLDLSKVLQGHAYEDDMSELMENPIARSWVSKELAEMKQRELELSEKEWFQMQFLESQLRGISMEPTSMEFIQFLDELEQKKEDWERRKQTAF